MQVCSDVVLARHAFGYESGIWCVWALQDQADEDEGPMFVNNAEVLHEYEVDEEDLPEADDDGDDDGDGGDDDHKGDPDDFDMDLAGDGFPEHDDSVHTFTGHKGPVYSVACSPTDTGLVATGGGDDVTYVWRVGDAESHKQLGGHTDSIASLAFSHDGQLLASGGLDGIVNIWDSSTGTLKQKLEGPGEAIEWVKWHPRGHVLLAGSEDVTAWLWNADTAACMAVLSGHSGAVTCGDFTPDGKTICTGSEDGSFRVWNPKSGESTRVVQGHPFHTEGLTCLAISNDSTIALTGSTDNNACIVNIQTGRVHGTLAEHSKSVESVGFSSGLNLVATGAMDGKLIIWDLQTLQSRCTCEHEDGLVKILWSPASQIVYTACLDGKIRAWDGRTGNCERTFQGHGDSILDLAISRDGNLILSGSDDGTARVFEF